MKLWRVSALVFVGILMLSTLFIPNIVRGSLTKIDIYNPTYTVYNRFINCTGEISEYDRTEVTLDVPVIAGEVYVKPGDNIIAGQKLMDIDKQSSIKYISEVSPSEVISTFFSSNRSNLSMSRISELLSQNQFSSDEILKDYLNTDLIPSSVYAPCSGKVTSVSASKGNLTAPLTTVVSISENEEKIANLAVNELNISDVKIGQSVVITGLAFENREYTGEIIEISDTARKTLNGTNIETVIDVKVKILDYDSSLKSGYTAKGRISITDDISSLVVPYEYVLQDDEGQEYVYIYENGRAKKKVIQTGMELSSGFEIISGIDESDCIISDPSKILHDDQIVILKGVD